VTPTQARPNSSGCPSPAASSATLSVSSATAGAGWLPCLISCPHFRLHSLLSRPYVGRERRGFKPQRVQPALPSVALLAMGWRGKVCPRSRSPRIAPYLAVPWS
jgi:hypothetical protein